MQGSSRTKSLQTTKWGTACAQCASAKAKCSRKTTDIPGTKCDRCERLLKQCTDQVHRPRKPRQPRQQQRYDESTGFDSLNVSPLVASSEGSAATSPAVSHNGSVSHPPSPQPSWNFNSSPLPFNNNNSPSAPQTRHLSVPRLYPLYTGQPRGSDEDLVGIFRNELMPQFPFVILHPDMTVDTLSASRPFLMSAIQLVASLREPQVMRGQIGQIMSYIADHVVVRGERTLDLLLGTLVVIGWYHYSQIQHRQLNSLLCLTESLIADLGLGQCSRNDGEARVSTEEKRALLGAWYLRSCVASQFNQLKPMPFTPFMQQCLAEINQEHEYETDQLLVLLVRAQQVTNAISSDTPEHALAATWKQLDHIVQNAPHTGSNNPLVTMAFNSAALRLQRFGSVRYNHTADSIKGWLHSWLSRLPPPTPFPIPTTTVIHLVYSIAIIEATSNTPREPNLWDSQFWDMLEERTLLSRSLVTEWAHMVEPGDEGSSQRPSEQHSSTPPIRLESVRPVRSGSTGTGPAGQTRSRSNNLTTTTTGVLSQTGQQQWGQGMESQAGYSQAHHHPATTSSYDPQVNGLVQWMAHPDVIRSWNTEFWQEQVIPTSSNAEGANMLVAGQNINLVGTGHQGNTSIDPQLWYASQQPHQDHDPQFIFQQEQP